jgi:site-specific recombinase XerC
MRMVKKQGQVTWLAEMKFSPSTINQRPAAIRKPATEAQRCGYVDSETAEAIVSVAGVSQKGRCLGRWLAWEEARTLQAPNPHRIRGMRDRALLVVLATCALRRGELSRMNCEHLAMRDGRWVFLDFLGKGNKTRSVAVPRRGWWAEHWSVRKIARHLHLARRTISQYLVTPARSAARRQRPANWIRSKPPSPNCWSKMPRQVP